MTDNEMTTGSVSGTDTERKWYAAKSRWWNSTGGGSSTKQVPGVTATSRGINNIKAGDGGVKFRAEWPEVDEENWKWMKENRIDPATGQAMMDPNAAASCSPETTALRRRPGGSAPGIGAVVNGQAAREGETFMRRYMVWIGAGFLLIYAIMSRVFGYEGQ